ncbi:MAG: HAMP domain-containing sensor histidine kinase, partial [Hyphomicrobiales bacterium]
KLQNAAKLSDPRFEQPQSGLYWQAMTEGGGQLRSRSMWDESFPEETPPDGSEEEHVHEMKGPGGSDVLVLERLVALTGDDQKEHKVVVFVAQDRNDIDTAISGFGRSLMMGIAALYLSLLAASLFIVRQGLRPLALLRGQVGDLRTGRAARIAGPQPEEVGPLTSEVNALVEAREKQLERVRQRAGNLAHGLKTPLTVLAAVASELEEKGEGKSARTIKLAAGQMRDLVDRELARSRMALGSDSHRSPLLANVLRVVETLKRAPKGDAINWQVEVPQDTVVAIDSTDLLELLGNLIDNARKHTKSAIRIQHDGKALIVEDDGPGVPPDKLPTIARRGVKLDALGPGTGLGLAIVSDLAEVYDFELGFSNGTLGGLRVSVSMPALS